MQTFWPRQHRPGQWGTDKAGQSMGHRQSRPISKAQTKPAKSWGTDKSGSSVMHRKGRVEKNCRVGRRGQETGYASTLAGRTGHPRPQAGKNPAHLPTQQVNHTEKHTKPVVAEPVTVSLCESGEIMYSLNLQNFYPKEIKIIWTYGPGQSHKPATSNDVIKTNPDLTYSIQSELKVPGDYFKDPNFIVCLSWEHSSLDHPEHREFCSKDPEFTWRPEIQEIPIPPVLLGKKVTLQYNISNYYPARPDALAVRWFKKEKGSSELVHLRACYNYKIPPRLTHNKQPDYTYSCTACLDVYPSLSSEQGAQFICRVEHPSLERPIERHTEPLQVKGKPEMKEPVKLTICGTGDMLCAMNLRHFYPWNLWIRWFWGENLIKSQEKYEENSDQTFNVLSECRINERDFQNPDYKIRTTWEHESMEGCASRDISIRDPEVFPWRPIMSEIAVPRLKVGERATLQCVISKYFPNALTIKWIKRTRSGHETQCLPPDYAVTDSPSHRLEDHSYSCETCLSFTPSIAEEDGAEFICRVQHPSLENPVSQSTGVLNVADMNTHWTGPTHSQPVSPVCNNSDFPKRKNRRNSSKLKKRKPVEDDKPETESYSENKRSYLEDHPLAAGVQDVYMDEASDGMGDPGEEDKMIIG
ncbi:Ig mu heavy chain disease -like [Pelobates cultripes]|uniref:Ig mu heavy chain disease -like n=1 Tax=Pelobates cultripes TaxID=61616 RepID=A0AAD1SQT1_PELCU|nr:Ig mu heavy chain disease -like [Pelobates cultripes]